MFGLFSSNIRTIMASFAATVLLDVITALLDNNYTITASHFFPSFSQILIKYTLKHLNELRLLQLQLINVKLFIFYLTKLGHLGPSHTVVLLSCY